HIRVCDGAEVVAELPIPLLTDEVFAYDLQVEPPAPAEPLPRSSQGADRRIARGEPFSPEGSNGTYKAALLGLLASPNLRSRRFAFRQYDSTVQGNTVLGPGHAAAVVRIDGTTKGLALTPDCNPRYMQIDPRRGAQQAVPEAAGNRACVRAKPIPAT